MKSLLINIGHADLVEAEAKINEQINSLTNFVSLKITDNGQGAVAVVLYDGPTATLTTPAVKLVAFSITDYDRAQETIDAVLEEVGGSAVSVEPTRIVDMNHLLVVYDAGATTADSASEEPADTSEADSDDEE